MENTKADLETIPPEIAKDVEFKERACYMNNQTTSTSKCILQYNYLSVCLDEFVYMMLSQKVLREMGH